jgi:hypothetical protein
MFYDRGFEFQKDRVFWTKVLMGIWSSWYLVRKISIERKRMLRAERERHMDQIQYPVVSYGACVFKA